MTSGDQLAGQLDAMAGCRRRSAAPSQAVTWTGNTTTARAIGFLRDARSALRQQKSAPLAQSAERLHGKNHARIGVLTSENASRQRPLCSELDALKSILIELEV
jgi:hypothetical protein